MAGIMQKLIAATGKSADEIMEILGKKGGDLVPPTAVAKLDDVAEAGVPAIRNTTIPTEVGPQVIGKGTSRVVPDSGDIIDAELVMPKVSTMDAVKEFAKNNKGKIAGGLTLAEISRQMMSGGGDEQPPVEIPFAPQAKKIESTAAIIPVEEDKKEVAPVVPSPIPSDIQAKLESGDQGRSPSSEEDELTRAQDADRQNQLLNTLLRAGIMGGAAFAQTKADYTGVDALDKTKGQLAANVKERQSYSKAQKEIGDDDKLRDTTSDISKTARELATKLGIKVTDKVSAKQLQDAGLPLGTLLSTQMAAEGRKEAAQLQREATGAAKSETNKLKIQASVDRQVSQLIKSKDYEAYNAAKDAQSALDLALETGDKTASGSAFMQFAKTAQGDNSVVRDGDMAILAGSYNYTSPKEMFSKLMAKAQGGNFNKKELEQMKAVAARVQQIKGQRVSQLLSPIIERTTAADINLAESLDPAVVSEFAGKSPKTGGLTTPGSETIKVRQIATGRVKEMTSDAADRLDKTKYEIVR